jgi:hypothetical protein
MDPIAITLPNAIDRGERGHWTLQKQLSLILLFESLQKNLSWGDLEECHLLVMTNVMRFFNECAHFLFL